MREPYADRFRLILNDLGAGLAARGKTLDAIIRRADPALRQTDRVLADPRGAEPAARPAGQGLRHDPGARWPASAQHLAGFISNANTAGQATAERSQDLEAGFAGVPRRAARAPLDDGRAAGVLRSGDPGVRGVPRRRARRSPARPRRSARSPRRATPALTSLGTAAAESQEPLVNSDPILRKIRNLAKKAAPGAKNLGKLLTSLRKTRWLQAPDAVPLLPHRRHQRLRPVRPLPARRPGDHVDELHDARSPRRSNGCEAQLGRRAAASARRRPSPAASSKRRGQRPRPAASRKPGRARPDAPPGQPLDAQGEPPAGTARPTPATTPAPATTTSPTRPFRARPAAALRVERRPRSPRHGDRQAGTRTAPRGQADEPPRSRSPGGKPDAGRRDHHADRDPRGLPRLQRQQRPAVRARATGSRSQVPNAEALVPATTCGSAACASASSSRSSRSRTTRRAPSTPRST